MPTTTDDVLEELSAHPDPVVTPTEIADRLPVSRRTVLERLKRLEERGDVASKKIGARAVAWWQTGAFPTKEAPPGGSSPTKEPTPEAGPSKESTDGGAAVSVESDQDASEEIDAVLEEIGTPPLTPSREEHRAAVAAAVQLLEEGSYSKSEFIDQLHAEHPAGYENERTWWRRVLKPALKAHSDVITPVGGNPWRLARSGEERTAGTA